MSMKKDIEQEQSQNFKKTKISRVTFIVNRLEQVWHHTDIIWKHLSIENISPFSPCTRFGLCTVIVGSGSFIGKENCGANPTNLQTQKFKLQQSCLVIGKWKTLNKTRLFYFVAKRLLHLPRLHLNEVQAVFFEKIWKEYYILKYFCLTARFNPKSFWGDGLMSTQVSSFSVIGFDL